VIRRQPRTARSPPAERFFADEDYQFFLDHLARLAKWFRCALHVYVLMTNHFHLLLHFSL
jgi:REP element-mobilizing transposase RayT